MITLRLGVVVAGAAALLAGCAGTKTDVSDGIEDLNRRDLAPLGAEIACPDEVDGGEGTEFECTLSGSEGGESRKVTLKIIERDGDLLVAPAREAEFDRAVSEVGSSRQPG